MSLKQRVTWVVVAVLAALAFGIGAPFAADAGPDTTTLEADTLVPLLAAEATVPAGWKLDIEAAAQSTVVATKDGVEVSTSDVIWLGSTTDLLARVAELAYPEGAVVPVVPDEDNTDRAVWTLTPDPAEQGGARRVVVITQRDGAVLVVVRGDAGSLAALAPELAEFIDSIELNDPELDVEAASWGN